MMDSLINQTLGQFQITRELGRGGMAVVYEAYQPALQRRVAIKVLPPQFSHDQAFIERFRHEAIAAANLSHPHIVTIYDVGQAGDLNYIVMELLTGSPLSSLIRQGPMPPARAAAIVEQVAAALDYAHQQGFVHRDIKPGNIMVGANDHVTLMDFGIARALSGTRLTQTGLVVGTPEYMAPEQITGEEIDRRTDVYALGIVAYEMLTGQVPFSGATASVLYKQANVPPPSPRSHLPGLPPAVDQVILRALSKRRDERFAAAGQFAQALNAAVRGQPATLPAGSGAATLPPAGGAQRRGGLPGWLLWLAGGAGVVLLLGVLALAALWLLTRQPQTAGVNTPSSAASATWAPTYTAAAPSVSVTPSATPPPTPMYGGARLAYTTGGKGAWQIIIADLSAGRAKPLPNQPKNSGVPAWSRDHTRLAFRAYVDGWWQIHTANADGANLRQVTFQLGDNMEPNWSPDGSRLVYVSNRDSNNELYITNLTGDQDMRLTNNAARDNDPNWSPDGQWIIFEREEDGCFNIYAIHPDGSGERALTHNTGADCVWSTTPAWSPDGKWIAYERYARGQEGYRIWIMDANGAKARALTSSEAEGINDVRPAWSPDGRWIAFSSNRSGVSGIYIVPVEGGEPQRIDAAGGFDPAW